MPKCKTTKMSLADFGCRFRILAGFVICGSTSGKSYFVSELITKRRETFIKDFYRVAYCYGEWQPAFTNPKKVCTDIEFIKDINPVLDNENFFEADKPTMLVVDDLAVAVGDDVRATKLFVQRIHHRKTYQLYSFCRINTSKG